EAGELRRQVVTARVGYHGRGQRRSRCLASARSDDVDRRDEAIALARDGFDDSRGFARVAQHVSDLENGRMNARIDVDIDVRLPQTSGDLVARHQVLWALQQQKQEIHWLPRKADPLPE